jgi:hypothetical protein
MQHYQPNATPIPFPINSTNGAINAPNPPSTQQGGQSSGNNSQSSPVLTAAGQTPTPAQLEGFNIFCNSLTRLISPGMCLGSSVFGGFLSKAAQAAIDYAISAVIKILNPAIQYITGVFGVAAGAGMMLFGIYALIQESQVGRQATGAVEGGAMLAATRGASGGMSQPAGPGGGRTGAGVGTARQPGPGSVTTWTTTRGGKTTRTVGTDYFDPEGVRRRNYTTRDCLNAECTDYANNGSK